MFQINRLVRKEGRERQEITYFSAYQFISADEGSTSWGEGGHLLEGVVHHLDPGLEGSLDGRREKLGEAGEGRDGKLSLGLDQSGDTARRGDGSAGRGRATDLGEEWKVS